MSPSHAPTLPKSFSLLKVRQPRGLQLLHFHPHFHVLLTSGAFTPQGAFLELPELDLERLQTAWQEAVFALYLAEEKIEPEVVENMRTWPHSGFSVDQSVFLPAGDRAGIERLVGYMTRCPFSLSRLVKVSETGQGIDRAEKGACRAFPDPQRDELARGPQRNFQILDPLEFLAEFTQHIPPKGAHLIRYYGWNRPADLPSLFRPNENRRLH